ncbi:MAG: ABC transporter ATP-binding protein [Clostridia bacterium]|nr:ABC transporter ATP-binding protein [Clostridia bacterium]
MIIGKYINKYYLKYGWLLVFGIIALIAVDYFQLEIPELYSMVLNGMANGVVEIDGQAYVFDGAFIVDRICMPMLLVILIMVVGRFLWRVCFLGSGIKVEANIRQEMFNHCKNLSQQYYQVNKVGNLMSLFTNDLETIQECFGWGVMMLCDALFLGGLAIVKMWKMNALLTLLSLIPMAMMLAVSLIVGKFLTKKWDKRQAAFSSLSDFTQENFSGIAVVKAFVKEVKELLAFKKINKENEEINVEYTKYSTLLRIFITLFIESVICVILGYGGYLVYLGAGGGGLNGGQLFEFIGYFNAVIWPVMAVSELIEMTSRGKASLKRVSELLDAKQDVVDKDGATEIEQVKGDIEFKDLSFVYPDGDTEVLKNVSFKISAGENVGIVGKTGSGKTTIVDLLLRVYNVPDGTLFIDGKDVNDVTISSVRKYMAYVPQDNFLFSDTIENNISFASDEKDFDKVVEYAKYSDIHDNVIEFKEGYQTVLGERGVTVSGGQKQRISIARALMKNAPVLILDDSVSAVDTKTERAILENLQKTRKGKTTILIAHRISTIAGMDKIIYLEDGKVLDVGKHDELYARCPEYKVAVDLQKLEDEKGESENA